MREKICGVYRIENTVTGECYVGSSTDIHRRWREHRTEVRSGRHKNKKLVRSWRKHGEEAHRFEILEVVSIDELSHREGYWIEHFEAASKGFNLLAFVQGRAVWNEDQRRERSRRAVEIWASKPLTDEQRKKRSVSAKRRIAAFPHTRPRASPDACRRTAMARVGIPLTEAHRNALSVAQRLRFKRDGGPEFSDKTRKKIADAHKGRPLSDEHKAALRRGWIKRKARQIMA